MTAFGANLRPLLAPRRRHEIIEPFSESFQSKFAFVEAKDGRCEGKNPARPGSKQRTSEMARLRLTMHNAYFLA